MEADKKRISTCEEGLHAWAVSQFDRCVSRVGGQSRVCTVVQKQPDYWKVITRYCIMERPKERKKQNTNAFQGWYNFSPHLNLFANKGYKMGDMYYNKTKVRLPVKYFPVINCNLLNC